MLNTLMIIIRRRARTSVFTPTYLNVAHRLECCKDQHKSQPQDYDIDELSINFHLDVSEQMTPKRKVKLASLYKT